MSEFPANNNERARPRPEFWSMNIGQVITMLTFIVALTSQGSAIVAQFTQARDATIELKAKIDDMTLWREKQVTEQQARRDEMNQRLDDVVRKIERLEDQVRGLSGGPVTQANRRK